MSYPFTSLIAEIGGWVGILFGVRYISTCIVLKKICIVFVHLHSSFIIKFVEFNHTDQKAAKKDI